MPVWLLWLLPAYEAGCWTTVLGISGWDTGKTRQTLLHGAGAKTALPYIDGKLRKAAGTPTKSQALVARKLTGGVRWVVGTRAFDYAILLNVRKFWPIKGQVIPREVKLCL
jgi:hypothetical protein